MIAKHTFSVDAAHSGARLDVYLARQLPTISRSRLKQLIESGHVTVDGRPSKPAEKVHRGQKLHVDVPPPVPTHIRPEQIPLDVLFEDRDLLVINKPAGLVVHPGAGRSSGTLVNAIIARIPTLQGIGGVLRPGIVHRLDKDTSGLLVVAKTSAALAALQAQIASREASRRYLALVAGVIADEEGTIRARIGRHPRARTKMAVVPRGREAITRYRVLERFARHTLIEAQLVTGRTHQIRVHFAHLGHPVVGDATYAARRDEFGLGRQALHAYRLQFRHPTTGEELVFDAPLPPDLADALARARAGEGSGPAPRKRRSKSKP